MLNVQACSEGFLDHCIEVVPSVLHVLNYGKRGIQGLDCVDTVSSAFLVIVDGAQEPASSFISVQDRRSPQGVLIGCSARGRMLI